MTADRAAKWREEIRNYNKKREREQKSEDSGVIWEQRSLYER